MSRATFICLYFLAGSILFGALADIGYIITMRKNIAEMEHVIARKEALVERLGR